jgi:hypothetical protein
MLGLQGIKSHDPPFVGESHLTTKFHLQVLDFSMRSAEGMALSHFFPWIFAYGISGGDLSDGGNAEVPLAVKLYCTIGSM